MIHALGYSSTDFNPADPGRLCRGRERWITPWPEEEPGEPISRVVITGARFTDDSARDALRGVPHSKVPVADLIAALFPRKPLLAFMEDGHPADIPEGADGVEAYTTWRSGGRSQEMRVRWHQRITGVAALRTLLAGEDIDNRVRGLAVLPADSEELPEGLLEALFTLVGMSSLDSPPARFQPAALAEVLQRVGSVVLLHRDKHGVALGIYGNAPPTKLESKLAKVAANHDSLLVPFAIPPMLARWDRALSELRANWQAETPFPVPEAEEASPWSERRRRRRRDRPDAFELDESLLVEEASADAPAEE